LGRYFRFFVLLSVKAVTRTLYRLDAAAIDGGPIPGYPWDKVRLVCLLNHTSLYEPIFVALAPNRFLWHIARRAVVPIAEITMQRAVLGRFLRLLIAHPVPITREADHTWEAVLRTIVEHEDALVIILPEGRMRRANGLDRLNRPMTARGGVAQIMQMLQHGRMLMAYSGGLHHVQIPGQMLPRLFKTIRMRFELLEIADYLSEMQSRGSGSLKRVVQADLDRRRDLHCPMTPESTRQPQLLAGKGA